MVLVFVTRVGTLFSMMIFARNHVVSEGRTREPRFQPSKTSPDPAQFPRGYFQRQGAGSDCESCPMGRFGVPPGLLTSDCSSSTTLNCTEARGCCGSASPLSPYPESAPRIVDLTFKQSKTIYMMIPIDVAGGFSTSNSIGSWKVGATSHFVRLVHKLTNAVKIKVPAASVVTLQFRLVRYQI